jgi:hypothetical protein
MSQYCRYYGIVASPLHRLLTRVTEPFPKQWLPGTDYDIAFHRIKSMMLDDSVFFWNKDLTKRLFIEVDACNEGWRVCSYQYADPTPPDVDGSSNGSASHGRNSKRNSPSSIKTLASKVTLLGAFSQPHRDAVPRCRHYRVHGPCSVHVRRLRYLSPGPYGGIVDPLSQCHGVSSSTDWSYLPFWLSYCSGFLARPEPRTASKASPRRTHTLPQGLSSDGGSRKTQPISDVRSDNKEDFDFLIAAPFAEKERSLRS